jgi:hypothetical protein
MLNVLEDFMKRNLHHKGIFLAGFTVSSFAMGLHSILIFCKPKWEFGLILFV